MSWGKYRKLKKFSVPIKKEIKKVDNKDGNEDITIASYKIKFIDRVKFMVRSLSNFVDNLGEGIHNI